MGDFSWFDVSNGAGASNPSGWLGALDLGITSSLKAYDQYQQSQLISQQIKAGVPGNVLVDRNGNFVSNLLPQSIGGISTGAIVVVVVILIVLAVVGSMLKR